MKGEQALQLVVALGVLLIFIYISNVNKALKQQGV
jgi:hypothetical protein